MCPHAHMGKWSAQKIVKSLILESAALGSNFGSAETGARVQMRHLPLALNLGRCQKLSNPDKSYLTAKLLKVKINAKNNPW